MGDTIQVTPDIQVLSPEAIARIHASSLRILSEIGIRVDSKRAIALFKSVQGVQFIDEQHLVIMPELVEWAIEQAPAVIDIYNRKKELVAHLGKSETRFGIGVTNLFYQDPGTDEVMPFTRSHMRSSVALGNSLNSYDFISTIGIVRDVPPTRADLVATLEMVANTIKPLIILVSDEKQFGACVSMLELLTGEVAPNPFVIPYFNPVTPLILNKSTAENMIAAIENGLPVIFSNYGMAGVTTPITSAGTLALLNAELLAGLVFSQLVKQGSPIILGSLPAFFDMKTMVDFFDPQTMLLNLACAELMDHYRIPHAGTSGSANGWEADLIASEALWLNHLTSAMGKVGLAPFVGGSLGSKVFSPALVVYANEIIEQVRQFIKGFIIDEETIAFEEIKKAGIGNNFISSRQTTKLFRSAYHSSSIFPRLGLEKWQELGQPTADRYLRERTLELLTHPSYPDDQLELLEKGERLINSFVK